VAQDHSNHKIKEVEHKNQNEISNKDVVKSNNKRKSNEQ